MKKIIALTFVSIFALSACGTTTVIREVAPSTTVAVMEQPITNKYDDYYNHVMNNSGQANSMAKSEIIEFGDVVCEALDNGRTIGFIIDFLDGYATSTSDSALFAAIIYGAITYLCPEYTGALQSYLST